jgi:transposase
MASTEIRERRRTLRYRNLLVRQAVQMKSKVAVLLMEAGVSYNKQRLHRVGYFRELLATNQDIDEGLRSLLRLCHETVVRLGKTESALVRSLQRDPMLRELCQRGGERADVLDPDAHNIARLQELFPCHAYARRRSGKN